MRMESNEPTIYEKQEQLDAVVSKYKIDVGTLTRRSARQYSAQIRGLVRNHRMEMWLPGASNPISTKMSPAGHARIGVAGKPGDARIAVEHKGQLFYVDNLVLSYRQARFGGPNESAQTIGELEVVTTQEATRIVEYSRRRENRLTQKKGRRGQRKKRRVGW